VGLIKEGQGYYASELFEALISDVLPAKALLFPSRFFVLPRGELAGVCAELGGWWVTCWPDPNRLGTPRIYRDPQGWMWGIVKKVI
jgi:hypothetical protein